ACFSIVLTKKTQAKIKKVWVHPINQLRLEYGEYHRLCKELQDYPDRYFHYFRMTKSQFDALLSQVEDGITKQSTNYRKCITAKERLVVTLRILATGISFRDAAYRYRMGESTVNSIVKETCSEICRVRCVPFIYLIFKIHALPYVNVPYTTGLGVMFPLGRTGSATYHVQYHDHN
ncbi:hypothetical protein NQ318_014911, partial [Aromia moschata]